MNSNRLLLNKKKLQQKNGKQTFFSFRKYNKNRPISGEKRIKKSNILSS